MLILTIEPSQIESLREKCRTIRQALSWDESEEAIEAIYRLLEFVEEVIEEADDD